MLATDSLSRRRVRSSSPPPRSRAVSRLFPTESYEICKRSSSLSRADNEKSSPSRGRSLLPSSLAERERSISLSGIYHGDRRRNAVEIRPARDTQQSPGPSYIKRQGSFHRSRPTLGRSPNTPAYLSREVSSSNYSEHYDRGRKPFSLSSSLYHEIYPPYNKGKRMLSPYRSGSSERTSPDRKRLLVASRTGTSPLGITSRYNIVGVKQASGLGSAYREYQDRKEKPRLALDCSPRRNTRRTEIVPKSPSRRTSRLKPTALSPRDNEEESPASYSPIIIKPKKVRFESEVIDSPTTKKFDQLDLDLDISDSDSGIRWRRHNRPNPKPTVSYGDPVLRTKKMKGARTKPTVSWIDYDNTDSSG